MAFTRILGALLLMTTSDLGQEIHYSPEERLDAIDAQLIATAKNSIDLASYAQTNPPPQVAQLLPSRDVAPP